MKDDDDPIRGQIRLADYRRVSHGLFVKKRANLTEHEEFLRDSRAILLVLPKGAVFTHLTAARLLGWQLPKKIEQTPYFAAVRGKGAAPRRPGVICSRLTHASRTSKVQGLPVDAPEEILLRAARDLGVLDLVIMIDSALRVGHLRPNTVQLRLRRCSLGSCHVLDGRSLRLSVVCPISYRWVC